MDCLFSAIFFRSSSTSSETLTDNNFLAIVLIFCKRTKFILQNEIQFRKNIFKKSFKIICFVFQNDIHLYQQKETITIKINDMNTAVNTQLAFGKLKMTIISELVREDFKNAYSLCRAEGVRGAIYLVNRSEDNKFTLIGKGF